METLKDIQNYFLKQDGKLYLFGSDKADKIEMIVSTKNNIKLTKNKKYECLNVEESPGHSSLYFITITLKDDIDKICRFHTSASGIKKLFMNVSEFRDQKLNSILHA